MNRTRAEAVRSSPIAAMQARIHPTAVIDTAAALADDVEIGPYAVIGPHVEIGAGSRVGAHTVITGHTRIGKHNVISHFASVGEAPQDKKYGGEPTRLEIGDNNTIREFCTLNRGTCAGRRCHAHRQRQLDHGLRAHRARLPDREPYDFRQ
jgi:acyl-[acyl carrier protein]--UDP-N-acetylglucosamine O-acyltransferase